MTQKIKPIIRTSSEIAASLARREERKDTMHTKIKDYVPTEDECVSACLLYAPDWDRISGEAQEKMIEDAKRWLLVWGHVFPEMTRY